jgi:hypothetical protein
VRISNPLAIFTRAVQFWEDFKACKWPCYSWIHLRERLVVLE